MLAGAFCAVSSQSGDEMTDTLSSRRGPFQSVAHRFPPVAPGLHVAAGMLLFVVTDNRSARVSAASISCSVPGNRSTTAGSNRARRVSSPNAELYVPPCQRAAVAHPPLHGFHLGQIQRCGGYPDFLTPLRTKTGVPRPCNAHLVSEALGSIRRPARSRSAALAWLANRIWACNHALSLISAFDGDPSDAARHWPHGFSGLLVVLPSTIRRAVFGPPQRREYVD